LNQSMTEIVVIGYGTARRKDVTGSISSIKAKDFNQGVILAPDQLLQGKVPGLEITNNSGQPGAATTIKIRGNNSLRANNNPLYVIDGVPLDGRTARPNLVFAGGLDFGTTPESNPLLYINPNDIAQIDVLKDASSAAIYGSRGANGIIVITTKKATAGTRIEFGANFGVAAGYMKKYKVLSASQFRDVSRSRNINFDSSGSVDALKEITQNDLSQNYNVAFSGGNEGARYRASFYGSQNQGFIKNTSLEKYLGNFSGQFKMIDNRLSVDFGVIAGHTRENLQLISNTPGAGGNLMAWALNWNPTKSFTQANGLFSKASNSIPNPVAVIEGFSDVADVNVFLGNFSAGYKIIKDLDYKFLYAINHGAGRRLTNADGWLDGIQGISGTGFAAISDAGLTSQTITHTLNYHKGLANNITFDAIAGYEYWKSRFSNSTVSASQFNTNLDEANRVHILYTEFFQNGKTQNPLTAFVDPRTEIQSYFGRVNFNLHDKYNVTATFRADGSSKFGKNNRYGYFPSVGARWMISNEDFFKGIAAFSNLSLRASWGITGNQEFPAGASLEQFNSSAYNNIGQSNVANPDLKWEKTTSYNVGIDYGILKNRIFGSLDYYYKNTTDLLFQSTAIQPAPASIFFINLPANLINQGVEFSVGAGVISRSNLSWDLNFNIAYNKNKLKNFTQAPILTGLINGQGVSGALSQIITNNKPINEYYLKEFRGFDQTGLPIISDDPIFAGDPNPHVLVGFSNTLRYKKLTLSLNASGAFGFLIYNNTYTSITNIGNLGKGQNVDVAAVGSSENLNAVLSASTRYLEKGDYMKLRNATFTYAFGDVGKYFKNLSVFVGGTNLFVITDFSGFDPEVNVDKSNNNYPSRSIEFIPYPTPRIITFGFNCTF
jgi:TonB-linked SusC/RagA family outer membrane protein